MDELTLGRKLYAFREDRKISQTKVEVETGLSFGTISRIENGAINPTKETLHRISTCLNLDSYEFTYLLGFNSNQPSELEVVEVVAQLQHRISETAFPAYLMDSMFRVWSWNKSLMRILDIAYTDADKYVGANYMRLLFSPELDIINMIPINKRERVLRQQVFRYRQMVAKYRLSNSAIEEINRLKKHPMFAEFWTKYDHLGTDLAFGDDFYIHHEQQLLSFQINMNMIQQDSRFFLVRYFPMDHKTSRVFENLRNENQMDKSTCRKQRPRKQII